MCRFTTSWFCRDWRDPAWKSVVDVRVGLQVTVRQQRTCLFGPNAIDIQDKPTVSLLIDEVCAPLLFSIFLVHHD